MDRRRRCRALARTAVDLLGAEPDPLAGLDDDDIDDIADRLDDDLLLIVRSLGGRWLARSAVLLGVDRYGLVAMVDEPGRRSRCRVPFPQRLDESSEMHAALGRTDASRQVIADRSGCRGTR